MRILGVCMRMELTVTLSLSRSPARLLSLTRCVYCVERNISNGIKSRAHYSTRSMVSYYCRIRVPYSPSSAAAAAAVIVVLERVARGPETTFIFIIII